MHLPLNFFGLPIYVFYRALPVTLPFPLLRLFPGEQIGGVLLVQREQKLHALGLAAEGLRTVRQIYGAVKGVVRLHQSRGHGERIVQVGQRAVRKRRPRIQDALRRRRICFLLGFSWAVLLWKLVKLIHEISRSRDNNGLGNVHVNAL